MKRIAWAAGLLVTSLAAQASARTEFSPALNGLTLSHDALRTYDFESADQLVGLELTKWTRASGAAPSLQRTAIATASGVVLRLTTAEDAIEGAHALRLDLGVGLAITDRAFLEGLAGKRFAVSLWTRADGIAPQLHVLYDRDPANVLAGRSQFAAVRGVRTGRATDDGWAEYSTGPLDGSIWGVPVRGVVVTPSSAASAAAEGNDFLVDALEITAVDGGPLPANGCTQANVDDACGAAGDCIFGHCVSSTVTWGALPSLSQRTELAERWIEYATRMIGDRNAVKNGVAILAPQARTIAASAVSSRQFFGGMNRLVNLLRDNHTSFGSPANSTSFAPQVLSSSSSSLGACFGIVDKDLMGGGLAYAVFAANETATSGVPLKRGDVVTAIDGQDPKAWVDTNQAKFMTTLPNDPSSDWGSSANALSKLVSARASTITLARCTSALACAGASRQEIVIDIANAVYGALTTPPATAVARAFACTPRFTDAVTDAASSSSTGEDVVNVAAGPNGATLVEFDGFVSGDAWDASMKSVFDPGPARVLMDARMGHGGYYSALQVVFDLVRGTRDPMGVISIGRGTYDLTDPPWLLDRLGPCADPSGGGTLGPADPNLQWTCFAGITNGFFASQAAPPGASSKIAWLDTYDVSANDFMPRLLAERSKFRIFGPHPTSGAFGSIVELPGLWTNWTGGSMQIQDSRFAVDIAGAKAARWESSHGVAPDQVVVQTLSDTLTGTDTMLAAANAWLVAP